MDEFTGEQARPDDDGAGPEAAPSGRRVDGRWRPDHVDRAEAGDAVPGAREAVSDETGASAETAASAADAGPDGVGASAKAGRGRWDCGERATGPIEGLAGEVSAVLTALAGPDGVDDESLTEAVVGLVRVRSLLDAVTAGFVARWDARSLWADDGSRAPRARLARDAGCHQASTGRVVRNARRTRSMPIVSEAWRDGRISTDHVERLVRAATPERAEGFAEREGDLVAVAAICDWDQFERAVAGFETAADDAATDPSNPDDLAKRDKRERAHRNMRPVQVGDRWHLPGSLDKVGGAKFAEVWERIRHELWEADMAAARQACGPDASAAEVTAKANETRTSAQRSADALVEMAARAATAPADGQRPRPLLTVIVNQHDLCGPIRQTFNGLVLSRLEVAKLLFEDADFERIIYGPAGQPVDVASPQRFFTGGWRRAVEVRDRVCQHPTCDVTAEYCQIDHIIEHSDGGETSVENGRLLCPQHNHQRPGRTPPPTSQRDRTDQDGGSGNGSTPNGDDDGDPDQPE